MAKTEMDKLAESPDIDSSRFNFQFLKMENSVCSFQVYLNYYLSANKSPLGLGNIVQKKNSLGFVS